MMLIRGGEMLLIGFLALKVPIAWFAPGHFISCKLHGSVPYAWKKQGGQATTREFNKKLEV